jgi:hypothetical protein
LDLTVAVSLSASACVEEEEEENSVCLLRPVQEGDVAKSAIILSVSQTVVIPEGVGQSPGALAYSPAAEDAYVTRSAH